MSESRSSGDAEFAGVRLTHPDRVLFETQGITKRDLAIYLNRFAKPILDHAANRLLSLVRCPKGQGGQCFFQRHGGAGLDEHFGRLSVEQKDGEREDYLYLTGKDGLIQAAQMGVLEFHIWGSHVDDIEKPDRLVFDLDPAEGMDFGSVKTAAAAVRDALEALGLRSFALLTGGKGIHVVAPLTRTREWPDIKAFASALAHRFEADDPDAYVASASKAKREGRIFIDYLRNERSNTAIAPYSPRAREGAPLAWPVDWAELGTIDRPDAFRLAEADPDKAVAWKDYGAVRQTVTKSAMIDLGLSQD
ncbi:non-homologous end-joining DNA ligase [Cucumibacter marinus]|uniref:non-homologous end-joining DNA ligase n=1 Tax=Cucumibacter marinus TaxID=1121252 RepID=UPI0004005EF5|nr:non-homologous end-joining DNA ligase [Cucumibacter marinus]